MKRILIPVFAAVALAGTPVLAQQSGSQSQGSGSSNMQNQGSASSAMQNMTAREAVRHAMEQSGFTNVRFIDAAYLVQAQSPSGERVVMFIDVPDSLVGGGQGGSQSGSMGGGSQSGVVSDSAEKSGSGVQTGVQKMTGSGSGSTGGGSGSTGSGSSGSSGSSSGSGSSN
ncbi:MAG: hypothetical protein KDG89_15465 [Geminicoccaceae bacterium]|nr:hypothetical protein [Geminicoccaceae bacterium]